MQFVRVACDPFSKFDNRHPTSREATCCQVTIIMPSDQLGVTEMMCARLMGAVRLRLPYAAPANGQLRFRVL